MLEKVPIFMIEALNLMAMMATVRQDEHQEANIKALRCLKTFSSTFILLKNTTSTYLLAKFVNLLLVPFP